MYFSNGLTSISGLYISSVLVLEEKSIKLPVKYQHRLMPRRLWPYVVCGQSSNVDKPIICWNHPVSHSKYGTHQTSLGNIYVKSEKSKVHLFIMMQRNEMVINRDTLLLNCYIFFQTQ